MMTTSALRTSLTVSDEFQQVCCDPCRFNGKTTIAMKYCRECTGHLCHNCVNTHMNVNSTQNHHVSYIITKRSQNHVTSSNNVSTIGYSGNLKDSLKGTDGTTRGLEMKCVEHGNHVVSFCLVHDALCCRVCICTCHRDCKLQVGQLLFYFISSVVQ